MKLMRDGMISKQKDIVLIPFPYTDFSTEKQRPALIISNKKMNKFEDLICCLITSNPTRDGILINKENFEKGKLPFKSWIKPYRIFTIHKKIVRKNLCTVKNKFFDSVIKDLNSYISRE